MSVTDVVDFPVIDKINAAGGVLIALASYIFGEHWILFAAFLVLNAFDYVTGTIKGRLLKIESSSAGLKGIVKKFSYWIMIVIAFGMCPVLNEIGETIGTDLSPFSPFIGWFTLSALMMNELRSILENLVECGVNVPIFLIKGFQVLEKVVQSNEDTFDASITVNQETVSEKETAPETPNKTIEKDSITLKIRTTPDDD